MAADVLALDDQCAFNDINVVDHIPHDLHSVTEELTRTTRPIINEVRTKDLTQ